MSTEPQAADIDFTGPFSIGEIIEIEMLTGRPVTELADGNLGHSLRVVAWVTGKRSNPEMTFGDAEALWVKLDG